MWLRVVPRRETKVLQNTSVSLTRLPGYLEAQNDNLAHSSTNASMGWMQLKNK
jgi:hypothetical protein